MRILLVENNKREATSLSKALRSEGYVVDVAADVEAGWYVKESGYHLAILDADHRWSRGVETLKELRAADALLPILVLVHSTYPPDRARALNLGADDCLSKPFSFAEFRARIHALLRRPRIKDELFLRVGDLELDRVHRTVRRGGRRIELTAKEFSLLEHLMLNADRGVTRAMILDHVWGLSFDPSSNVVDVYVHYLREKLETGCRPRLIHTVRGVGYELGLKDGGEAGAEAPLLRAGGGRRSSPSA